MHTAIPSIAPFYLAFAVENLARTREFYAMEPYIRFAGQVGERATMFFYDPSGNAREFKSFRDRSHLFVQ